jgi:hypothetical protein
VGFLDRGTLKCLKEKGLDLSDSNVVVLESRLMNAGKYKGRHTRQGNAPAESDWLNLVEYLVDASIYLDKGSLIFLRQVGESKFVKIAVDLDVDHNFKPISWSKPFLPKVDSMYLIDISTEHPRGSDAYRDITKKKKIR